MCPAGSGVGLLEENGAGSSPLPVGPACPSTRDHGRMMTTIRLHLAAAALAGGMLFAADVSAQALPQAWTRVADSGESASVEFMEMSPGWHLGPGPAGLVYQEDHVLGDTFRVEYEAHAFAGDPAAFGVFFGGRGLRPESYDFFEVMLDTSGRYSLGHRAGPEYHEVVAWTEHEAVRVPTAAASALNRLSIDVSPARLAVSVKGWRWWRSRHPSMPGSTARSGCGSGMARTFTSRGSSFGMAWKPEIDRGGVSREAESESDAPGQIRA